MIDITGRALVQCPLFVILFLVTHCVFCDDPPYELKKQKAGGELYLCSAKNKEIYALKKNNSTFSERLSDKWFLAVIVKEFNYDHANEFHSKYRYSLVVFDGQGRFTKSTLPDPKKFRGMSSISKLSCAQFIFGSLNSLSCKQIEEKLLDGKRGEDYSPLDYAVHYSYLNYDDMCLIICNSDRLANSYLPGLYLYGSEKDRDMYMSISGFIFREEYATDDVMQVDGMKELVERLQDKGVPPQ